MAAVCTTCLSPVPQSHQRRRLYGESSAAVLAELRNFEHGSRMISSNFLCLKCFSLLQRSAKMRRDLAKLGGEIGDILSKTATSIGIQATPVTPG